MIDRGLHALLQRHLSDHRSGWSCGGFGAIAEFAWDEGEAIELAADRLEASTGRGAIRIGLNDEVRAIAYELGTRDATGWQHGLALCVRTEIAAGQRRRVVTELGPDDQAIRPQDRAAILFDLGLDVPQADICVRSADPETIALLRGIAGQPMFTHPAAAHLPRLSPHRVFRCGFGRVEVFQPIPPPDGVSPDGPHTHVLPRLLAQGLTHAANIPLPEGWVPCMTLFPPSPIGTPAGHRKPFSLEEHDAFQAIWRSYGEPHLVALKAAFRSGAPVPEDLGRAERTVLRVAARQAACLDRFRNGVSDPADGSKDLLCSTAFDAEHEPRPADAGKGFAVIRSPR